jgi:hypothetical protein
MKCKMLNIFVDTFIYKPNKFSSCVDNVSINLLCNNTYIYVNTVPMTLHPYLYAFIRNVRLLFGYVAVCRSRKRASYVYGKEGYSACTSCACSICYTCYFVTAGTGLFCVK